MKSETVTFGLTESDMKEAVEAVRQRASEPGMTEAKIDALIDEEIQRRITVKAEVK